MKSHRILVLTSTFPQFRNDPRGRFVSQYWARRQNQGNLKIRVLAPRSDCSRGGRIDELEVRRFNYAPKKISTLTGRFGILENLREFKWRWGLVPLYFFGQCNALIQEIREFSPDLVVAHMFIPSGIAAAWICHRKGIPFHLYGHGSDFDVLMKLPKRIGQRCFKKMAFAERWYFPSREKLERVCSHLQDTRLRLPSLHVEYMKNRGELQGRGTVPGLEMHLGQEGEELFSILYVGRLTKQKGVDVLLRAAAQVRSRLRIDIAGDGPEWRNLVELARKLGVNARFHGFVNTEIRDQLYASAKVLCVPSRMWKGMGEGAPLVICEAQRFDLDVIASAIGGIPELCSGYSKSHLVPPDNISAFRQVIEELEYQMSTFQGRATIKAREAVVRKNEGGELFAVRAC